MFQIGTHEIEPGVLCVALAGEFDIAAADQLLDTITRAVSSGRVTTVHIDLGAVTFVDSTAIGVLVRGRLLADQHNTEYRVVNARGHVGRVLAITGVLGLLTGEHADESGGHKR